MVNCRRCEFFEMRDVTGLGHKKIMYLPICTYKHMTLTPILQGEKQEGKLLSNTNSEEALFVPCDGCYLISELIRAGKHSDITTIDFLDR